MGCVTHLYLWSCLPVSLLQLQVNIIMKIQFVQKFLFVYIFMFHKMILNQMDFTSALCKIPEGKALTDPAAQLMEYSRQPIPISGVIALHARLFHIFSPWCGVPGEELCLQACAFLCECQHWFGPHVRDLWIQKGQDIDMWESFMRYPQQPPDEIIVFVLSVMCRQQTVVILCDGQLWATSKDPDIDHTDVILRYTGHRTFVKTFAQNTESLSTMQEEDDDSSVTEELSESDPSWVLSDECDMPSRHGSAAVCSSTHNNASNLNQPEPDKFCQAVPDIPQADKVSELLEMNAA